MTENIDKKELKILADILALVLENEPGQSANALETLKKRAKKNMVTGGTIKNIFYSIAENPPKPETKPSSRSRKSTTNNADLIKARSQITSLTQDINRLDTVIRSLRVQNESLRSELLLTQQSRAEIQSVLYSNQAKEPFKKILGIIFFICGLLIGIATTAIYHSVSSTPPPNNSIYLN